MLDRVAELAAAGRALAPQQRMRLRDLLPESQQEAMPNQLGDAWKRQVGHRVASHERGEGALHEADDVITEAAHVAPSMPSPSEYAQKLAMHCCARCSNTNVVYRSAAAEIIIFAISPDRQQPGYWTPRLPVG